MIQVGYNGKRKIKMMNSKTLVSWTIKDADELYGVSNWGSGYFKVSEKGELTVVLKNAEGRPVSISLFDTVSELKDRGMELPILLRFGDLLDSRIALLNQTFNKAISDAGYRGEYRGIFPIKVNQQQQVVEEICAYGKRFHHGLEAGSKAELIIALAYMHDPDAYIICNGYKDEEFIDLALYGLKMGIQTILVLEMPGELSLVLERAEKIGVRPRIGIRMKLSSIGSGHWNESGGDRSVFGLNTAQAIDVIDSLKRVDMLDCLHLLHFHVGSQITNIRNIRSAVTEASRIYADMVKEGAPMGLLNVGGGLAVDYDGSHTNSMSSCNYSLDEYCADIVEAVMTVANESGIVHPTIISESGRAIVAYYSVLLFNILDVSRFESHGPPSELPDSVHEMIHNLMEVSKGLSRKKMQECFNDAVYYRDEIRSNFMHGNISLRERAIAEQVFWHIISWIAGEIATLKHVPEELKGLDTATADMYHANFSIFQSIPDSWAIEQLFPVLPIHRLNEPPCRKGIITDITCDCDGKLDRFIDVHDIRYALPLHGIKDNEEYVLGVFLVGAYQETLGDLHNLFGDTNIVSVKLDSRGEIEYTREIEGDSVADVLSYVEYDNRVMAGRFKTVAEQAVKRNRITSKERRTIVDAYQTGLRGYTYYEK